MKTAKQILLLLASLGIAIFGLFSYFLFSKTTLGYYVLSISSLVGSIAFLVLYFKFLKTNSTVRKVSAALLTLIVLVGLYFVSPLPQYFFAQKLSPIIFNEKIDLKHNWHFNYRNDLYIIDEYIIYEQDAKKLAKKDSTYWQRMGIIPTYRKIRQDAEYAIIQWQDTSNISFDFNFEERYLSKKEIPKAQKLSAELRDIQNQKKFKLLAWKYGEDEGYLTDYEVYLLSIERQKLYRIQYNIAALF